MASCVEGVPDRDGGEVVFPAPVSGMGGGGVCDSNDGLWLSVAVGVNPGRSGEGLQALNKAVIKTKMKVETSRNQILRRNKWNTLFLTCLDLL